MHDSEGLFFFYILKLMRQITFNKHIHHPIKEDFSNITISDDVRVDIQESSAGRI